MKKYEIRMYQGRRHIETIECNGFIDMIIKAIWSPIPCDRLHMVIEED